MWKDGQKRVSILCFLSLTYQGGPPVLVFILTFIRDLTEEERWGRSGLRKAEIRPHNLLTTSALIPDYREADDSGDVLRNPL